MPQLAKIELNFQMGAYPSVHISFGSAVESWTEPENEEVLESDFELQMISFKPSFLIFGDLVNCRLQFLLFGNLL